MAEPKKWIPQFIKFPLWYIFKAPQRKLNPASVLLDFLGILLFPFAYIAGFLIPLKPISICVGIYNRSNLFLKHFVTSLANAKNLDLIELSVADCGSNDVHDLETEIKKIYSGKLVFSCINEPFARAKSFNRAVKQSNNSKIFNCDADFSIPQNIVRLVNCYTLFNMAWFPIVFYLYKDKPAVVKAGNGHWMQWGGKGIMACNKKAFYKVGMLNEQYTTWGYEDEELWQRFHKHGYIVFRNRCKGLIHFWHPSLNPKYQ